MDGAAKHNDADPLKAAVRRTCREHSLLEPGVLLVAVSGGADSVCLLHLLTQLAPEFGVTLHVVHFNHRLRGAESEADASFVAALAARLALPVSLGAADVAAVAATTKQSLEAAAHQARWAFFEQVRAETGAGGVATGHTTDDQAETVVMHFLRGSGLRGLAGLAPNQGAVRRPLLTVRHADCVSWCRAHGVDWREDATNAEPWCRRNAVRLEVLPFLRRYNPGLDAALAGTAQALQADLAYLDEQAGAALQARRDRSADDEGRLSLAGYQELPEAVRRHLLLRWLGRGTRRTQVDAVDRLLREGRAGDAVVLAGGRQVVRRYTDALLAPLTADAAPAPVALAVPGTTLAPAWGWTIRADVLASPAQAAKDRWTVELDGDRVALPLQLRARRPGDRLQLLGVAGPKKLQDILVDAKVPRRARDHVGVVEAANGIVWLVGWRLAAGVAAGPGSRHVVRLAVTQHGEQPCDRTT